MVDLDELLNRSTPVAVKRESQAARSARALAVSVASSHPKPRRRWRCAIGLAGVFVIALPAAAVAAPALFDWSWESADTITVQEFPVGDDPATGQQCLMAIWAKAEPGESAEVTLAAEKAQAFLRDQDWSELDDDSTNIWARQRQAVIDNGSATPVTLASLTAAQVNGYLEDAGLLVPGMSTSTRIDCGDEAQK